MPTSSYTFDPTLYRDVETAQNACNARALLNSWNRWADRIKAELEANGCNHTDAFNRHPLNVIMADKMLQLGGHDVNPSDLNEAYNILIERAR